MDLDQFVTRLYEIKDINVLGQTINTICDNCGHSFLHVGIRSNRIEIVERLLKSRYIDINCRNKYGSTPLLEVVKSRKPSNKIARMLIENGADVNAVDSKHNTPLHYAVRKSNFELVAMLLYYGADPSIVNEGRNPFTISLDSDVDVEIQKLLMEYETDFNRVYADVYTIGFNTLDLAMMNCCSPLVIIDIIERGATTCSVTSLFQSLQERNFSKTDCLRILHSIFSSDDICDMIWHCENWNSLSCLIELFSILELTERESYPFVCILLSWGADVDLSDAEKVLELYGYNETLKLFLQVGVKIPYKSVQLSLPYLLCNVQEDAVRLLNKLDLFCFLVEQTAILLNYFTPSSEFMQRYHTEKCQNNYRLLSCPYVKILEECSVPLLTELSRDATRKAICSQFAIKNSSHFYTLLNRSPIPKIVRQIITYELPLYHRV